MNQKTTYILLFAVLTLALLAMPAFAQGGGKGEGRRGPGGQGGPGQGGPKPMFGTITAVSGDSITIKPEVPAFLEAKMAERKTQMEQRRAERQQKMAERGVEGNGEGRGRGPGGEGGPRGMRELPESVTVSLTGETRFLVNSAPQSTNPFKVGDKVAIVAIPAQGASDSFSARAVADYASAEAKMAEMGGKMQERREKRKENRQQRREKRQGGGAQ